jgi:hypothetical protein
VAAVCCTTLATVCFGVDAPASQLHLEQIAMSFGTWPGSAAGHEHALDAASAMHSAAGMGMLGRRGREGENGSLMMPAGQSQAN